jgi:hypothetical protein
MPGDADDTASFQRAFEQALGHNLLDPTDDERHQTIYAPSGLYHVSDEFGITVSGEFTAPIAFRGDGTATQIRGVNSNVHDMLVIRNTGGGNLRHWSVENVYFVNGSRAITLQKVHYGRIENVTMDRQWITALDINTNGDAESIKIIQPRILQQRGFSFRSVSGFVSIDGLDCGEMCGEFLVQGGGLELNHPKIFGTALNRIKADQFPARDPDCGASLFTLISGAELRIRGGDILTTDACKTLVCSQRGGDVFIDANIKLAPGTDTVLAENHLYGNSSSWIAKINVDPLVISANTHLYRQTKGVSRAIKQAAGVVRSRNGAALLADPAHPIDASGVSMLA